MTYDEILAGLRAKMTGETRAENEKILREEGLKFGKEGNYNGVRAVGELLLEVMPEAEKQEVQRLTHLDGIRIDEYYKNIAELVGKGECVDAKPLAEKLYYKVVEEYAEGEEAKFVSLKNPFEDNLYQYIFKPEKKLNRAPFDFCRYLTTYGYILFETGSPLDAIPVLEKAMEYNRVECSPKFELAEVYKIIRNKQKLIEITQETLKVASSPQAIARCYANMGYMCTDFRELDDAVAFYCASVMIAPHPAIPRELQGIAQMKGEAIVEPSFDKIKEILAKYGMEFGPDKDVISVAASLSSHYMIKKDMPNALMALKMLYNLTRDPKVLEMIKRYEPGAKLSNTAGVQVSGGTRNITRTVNENPENGEAPAEDGE